MQRQMMQNVFVYREMREDLIIKVTLVQKFVNLIFQSLVNKTRVRFASFPSFFRHAELIEPDMYRHKNLNRALWF